MVESAKTLQLKIAALEREVRKYKRLMHEDELTKILNRRGFLFEAGRLFKEVRGTHATRERRKHGMVLEDMAVLLFDIDHFKSFNDRYGHDTGDIVLRFVAHLVAGRLRASDVFGRWGGEEFVACLPFAHKSDAFHAAQDICSSIAQSTLKYHGHMLHVTVSIGVASFSKQDSLFQIVEQADKAMYWAKRNGRNQVKMAP